MFRSVLIECVIDKTVTLQEIYLRYFCSPSMNSAHFEFCKLHIKIGTTIILRNISCVCSLVST